MLLLAEVLSGHLFSAWVDKFFGSIRKAGMTGYPRLRYTGFGRGTWDRLNKSIADEVVLGRLCPISLGFRSTFSQH